MLGRGFWVLGRRFGHWTGIFGCPGVPLTHLWRPTPPAAPEDVARGSDALTLLENAETRNQFIDELMEVRGHPGDAQGTAVTPRGQR